MRDRERAIDKIRVLLELSKSDNTSEAANAAAKAAKIMAKHGLDESEIVEDDPVSENFELGVEVGRSKKVPVWIWNVAWAVAESSHSRPCTAYRLSDKKISATLVCFIGRRSDAELASYLFAFLISELRRLHSERVPPIGKRIQQYIPGTPPPVVDKEYQRRWTHDFYYGASVMIVQRMAAAKETVMAGAASTALVRLATIRTDVEAAIADLKIEYVAGNQVQVREESAYNQGVRAASEIDLSRDHIRLGEGQPKLPGSVEE